MGAFMASAASMAYSEIIDGAAEYTTTRTREIRIMVFGGSSMQVEEVPEDDDGDGDPYREIDTALARIAASRQLPRA